MSLKIQNLNNCIRETQESRVPRINPYNEMGKIEEISIHVRCATKYLSDLYQKGFSEPFINYLKSKEPVWSLVENEDQVINDFASAIIQKENKPLSYSFSACLAFNEVISDLFNRFAFNANIKDKTPLTDLPPLAAFVKNDEAPYTWNSGFKGIKAGVVALPIRHAFGGIFAWTTLPHEVCGHDISFADPKILGDLKYEIGKIKSVRLTRSIEALEREQSRLVNDYKRLSEQHGKLSVLVLQRDVFNVSEAYEQETRQILSFMTKIKEKMDKKEREWKKISKELKKYKKEKRQFEKLKSLYQNLWLSESFADVLGVLGMGPAAGIGLIGYFRSFRSGGKLLNSYNGTGPHPVDTLRALLLGYVVKKLEFKESVDWSNIILDEAKKDIQNNGVMIQNKFYPLKIVEEFLEYFADIFFDKKLESLSEYSLNEIITWKSQDEKICSIFKKYLLMENLDQSTTSLLCRVDNLHAGHVVAAATTTALAYNPEKRDSRAKVTTIFENMILILREMHTKNRQHQTKTFSAALKHKQTQTSGQFSSIGFDFSKRGRNIPLIKYCSGSGVKT